MSRKLALTLPSPSDLGLPSRFTSYRPQQIAAVHDIISSELPTSILNAPTGVGKSLIVPTISILESKRVLVVTATKVLQDLYHDLFEDAGMVDVRGANNYPCPALLPGGQFEHMNRTATGALGRDPDPRADKGPCLSGFKCSLRGGGCPRYDQIAAARQAPMVVTNYDCWLAQGKMLAKGMGPRDVDGEVEEPLGDFDYIFLDELHDAASKVSDAVRIELDTQKFRELLDGISPLSPSDSIPKWISWAKEISTQIVHLYDQLKMSIGIGVSSNAATAVMAELRELQSLHRLVGEMVRMDASWVIDTKVRGRVVVFEPVWAGRYCESLLYRGIPRRVGMSATIRPAALKYVGVGDGEYDFYEYESPFPPHRRTVWQWPAIQLNWKTEKFPSTQRAWAEAIDKLRSDRMDRKGIGDSVSYHRAELYGQLTAIPHGLMSHAPKQLDTALDRFHAAPPGTFFDSPSIHTGIDFPLKLAEWGVSMKCPYPSMESVVMRARVKDDRMYPSVYAADRIVQFSGRTARILDPMDLGETILMDSTVGALLKQTALFPKWWRRAWKFTREAPRPPARLR